MDQSVMLEIKDSLLRTQAMVARQTDIISSLQDSVGRLEELIVQQADALDQVHNRRLDRLSIDLSVNQAEISALRSDLRSLQGLLALA